IKDYRLQYRVNNGAWHTVYSATTRTTLSLKVAHGKTIQFRARARDMRLNVGPWTVGPGIRS
ncbi:MAG: hypothetical protein ACXWDI_16095, partial [Nocardioides sp.]